MFRWGDPGRLVSSRSATAAATAARAAGTATVAAAASGTAAARASRALLFLAPLELPKLSRRQQASPSQRRSAQSRMVMDARCAFAMGVNVPMEYTLTLPTVGPASGHTQPGVDFEHQRQLAPKR